jgi:Tol biopolymer transport system component
MPRHFHIGFIRNTFQFLVMLCAIVLAALAADAQLAEAPGENSGWPEKLPPDAATIEERVLKLDSALEQVRGELSVLRHDLADNSGRASPPLRRKEPSFRGIYTMNRDGSNVEFLAAAPGMIANADPQFSNDGTMIAFGGVPEIDQPVKGKIFVVALAGPFKGRIRDFGHGNSPAFSPDGRQIAYMVNPGNPIGARYGAWIMNADGTERRWLANGYFPRFSPDGKKVVSHGVGPTTLIVTDLATGDTQPILNAPGWQLKSYSGAWSPKGDKVAFVATFEGKDRLAIINSNGDSKTIKIIATNEDPKAVYWGPPAWSPDGRELVFPIGVSGNVPRSYWQNYIYSTSADGSSQPKLVEGKKVGNINRGPAFSTDGQTIAFSSER